MAYAPTRLVPPEAPYGALGVVTGLTLNEFFAEWAGRVSGQTGWGLVGVKALVKGLLGAAFWGLAARVTGPILKLFLNVVGYTTTGTIIWDVFRELYPGGIWGIAEAAAVMARGAAAGARVATAAFAPTTVPFRPAPFISAAVPTLTAPTAPTRSRGL
ncbi:MAG: hypothetical protein QXH03_02705 [Candidatus Bathyarchaeia archaeon]